LKSTAIVIDDEPDVRDVFSECLPLFDVDVLAKGNDGKEAVELYKKYNPEIVLMDVLMPLYDGVYGLKKIREIDPNAKIIIITASIDGEIEKKLVEENASAIIWKPFDMEKVQKTIERVKNGETKLILRKNSR
jgi:DNA-binding NarL/FixJ family response regulator